MPSRQTPPGYTSMQGQSHSYANNGAAYMGGYPTAPPPSTSWGMASAPPSPVNLGRPTSTELRSSPVDETWPQMEHESPYGHVGVMSGDVTMPVYYGQPPRTITPNSNSASVASTPSDFGHGRSASALGQASYASGPGLASTLGQQTESLRPAHTGPARRRGASETADPAEYERQRVKKKEYAKSFRDNEKLHFEKLRRRLFPADPNTRRAECLERAISALNEIDTYKVRAVQREAEIDKLRTELALANQRVAELEQFVAQSGTAQVSPQPPAGSYQGYGSQTGWR